MRSNPVPNKPANLQYGTSSHMLPQTKMGALKKWRVLVSDLGCEYETWGYFYRQYTINYQVQVPDAHGLKTLKDFRTLV